MNHKIKDKWNCFNDNFKNTVNDVIVWAENNPEKAAAIISGTYAIAQMALNTR